MAKGMFGILRRKGFTVDRGPTPDFNFRVPTVRNTSLAHYLAGGAIPVTAFRRHDALEQLLPATSTGEHIGLTSGTFGSDAPVLETADEKASSTTEYARVLIPILGSENVRTAKLVVNCGMKTTVADDKADLTVEAVRQADPDTDICVTAKQSFNSLTAADKEFVFTTTNWAKNDVLDVRLKVEVTDAATGTAVIAQINRVTLELT